MKRAASDIKIRNKKAEFEYFIIDRYTAGIVLKGTEIKSIREGKANLVDAYCSFWEHELFVKNMHIAEYKFGSYYNHKANDDRKLLLNKRELRKLELKVKDKGVTIVPLLLFVNENGIAKLEIALVKGKKLHDKRETIKEKDIKREMDRREY